MKGKVADFCDKSMIAALYIARFGLQLLRVLISFFVLTVLVIFTPLLLVADKLAEVCACPRCGGGRIAFGLQAVADFISAILGPMTEAYEWANDKVAALILAAWLKQAELRSRITQRRRQL